MRIDYQEALTDEQRLADIWGMLCTYDHEFVPRLSARANTFQSELSRDDLVKQEPVRYYENLKQQSFLLAFDEREQQVIGFMSFRPEYICEDLQDDVVTLYITTIIVEKSHRGRGITTSFYREIALLADQRQLPITTRTWSTNHSHIHLLNKLGFQEVLRLRDGRGSGIDTVYFRK